MAGYGKRIVARIAGPALIGGICTLLFSISQPAAPLPAHELALRLYQKNLVHLDHAFADLTRRIDQQQSAGQVQASFRRARLAYKYVEPLTEYYFLQSAKNLNGPNVPEGEVDEARPVISKPEGFQVIEPMLFPFDPSRRVEIQQQLTTIRQTVRQLQTLATSNPMTDAFIFDALRQAVFRIETLGITGFDSPLALYSLPEAEATLDGIRQTLACFPLGQKDAPLAGCLDHALVKAQKALRSARNSDDFDRLDFIRNYANPLSGLLLDAHHALGLPAVDGKRLLRFSARTLSDTAAFDPAFFANHSDPAITPARIALGKQLFSDPVLSAEGSGRSCATCHRPNQAFQDGLVKPQLLPSELSMAIRPDRNTPTLWNVGLQSAQFMDMRVFTIEQLLHDVIHNSREMGGSLAAAVPRLNQQASYRAQFMAQYADGLTAFNVRHALATYVRSLISLDSRTDQYLRGKPVALPDDERLGFNVFMGKGKCATCHYFPLYNGTLPPGYRRTEVEVIGTPSLTDPTRLSTDWGRGGVTGIDFHRGAFKIPSLRRIGQTAPYMHNGVFNTLEEVVDFYDKGGGAGLGFSAAHQTLPIEKLQLTPIEKKALVAFMKSL